MLRNRRGFARIKATILLAVLIVVLAVVGVPKEQTEYGDSYKQHIGKGRSGERYQCYKISV